MTSEEAGCSSKNEIPNDTGEGPAIVFKKIKRKKCLRTTTLSDDEDSSVDKNVLEDTKELQKLRKRPHGVSAAALVLGKPVPVIEEKISDPFKIESGGGLTEMKASKKETIVIGNQFASETNERDEDADMMKYIEAELKKKRQGTQQQTDAEPKPLSLKSEDLLMQILPSHLERSQGQKNEEMLSNQMLAGIPEVDLGIEERIRNIEATEEAKMRMLHERMSNKRKETSLVPTNISVNFESQQKKPKKPERREREPGGPMRASDDAHLEKFRKHFNRR